MAQTRVAVGSLVTAARPRQWTKNVLVAAGPLAAGWPDPLRTTVSVVIAFACFCVTASAIYLVNDVVDRDADRAHPTKRNRPIASGAVGVRPALVLASILLAAGQLVALTTGRWQLAVALLAYTVIQLTYCIWFKHQPVIDLVLVASGFLLRAVAGGAAAGVVLSQWFLLVAAFGSLFMVAGKRYSEKRLVGEEITTRRSLENYSASYLRFVWGMSATATVAFYCLWAFQLGGTSPVLAQLSIVPFVTALLRYAVDIDRGAAGEPESIVLGDRVLQAVGLIWVALFAANAVQG